MQNRSILGSGWNLKCRVVEGLKKKRNKRNNRRRKKRKK